MRYLDYSIAYTGISTGLLACHSASIHLALRRRERHPNDSLLVLHHWPRWVRMVLSFTALLFSLVPSMLFIVGYIGAAGMMVAESWTFETSFEYVICNILGTGPLVSIVPKSVLGRGLDIVISLLTQILAAAVLGVFAATALVLQIGSFMPAGAFGLTLAIFVISLACMLLALLCSLVLVPVENIHLGSAFTFMIGLICRIEDPLTTFQPSTSEGEFFTAICSCLQLGTSGAIIGILGGHPRIIALVAAFQGANQPDDTSVAQGSSKCDTPNASQPLKSASYSVASDVIGSAAICKAESATSSGRQNAPKQLFISGSTGLYRDFLNATMELEYRQHNGRPFWRSSSSSVLKPSIYLFHTGNSRWVISKRLDDGSQCYAFVFAEDDRGPAQCVGPWMTVRTDGQWVHDGLTCVEQPAVTSLGE